MNLVNEYKVEQTRRSLTRRARRLLKNRDAESTNENRALVSLRDQIDDIDSEISMFDRGRSLTRDVYSTDLNNRVQRDRGRNRDRDARDES